MLNWKITNQKRFRLGKNDCDYKFSEVRKLSYIEKTEKIKFEDTAEMKERVKNHERKMEAEYLEIYNTKYEKEFEKYNCYLIIDLYWYKSSILGVKPIEENADLAIGYNCDLTVQVVIDDIDENEEMYEMMDDMYFKVKISEIVRETLSKNIYLYYNVDSFEKQLQYFLEILEDQK